MKMSSQMVERTLSQFEAQPVPDDHPAVTQLRFMRNAPFQFNPKDWFAFFGEHGWRASEIRCISDEANPFPCRSSCWSGSASRTCSRRGRAARG